MTDKSHEPPSEVFLVVHRPKKVGLSVGTLAVAGSEGAADAAILALSETWGFIADDLDIERWRIGEILREDES
jgi:hypothetical protein